jgi:hypothetical protein
MTADAETPGGAAPAAAPAPPGRGLRRFVAHVAAFLIAPALLLLLCEAVLLHSGEMWTLDRVFAYQHAHADALYLRALDQQFYAYKYRGIFETRPAVLVAGSSRTMKFRAPMFGARRFYNAGGMINSLRDLDEFSRSLPAALTPAVLLVGVDLWWLNDGVAPTVSFREEIAKGARFTTDDHIVAIRWLVEHAWTFGREALALFPGDRRANIGIAARATGGGFRLDGSYQSPLPVPRTEQEWTFVDRESPPIIERVMRADQNFPPADGLSRERLALLDRVLARFEQRHVLVVGYLPPFSSAVRARLESDPRHRTLFAEFLRLVPDCFRAHGFPVADATDTAAYGMDDRAMSDGIHPEETFQVHVLRALLREPRIREALPGAEPRIEHAMTSPRTNFWVPDLGT